MVWAPRMSAAQLAASGPRAAPPASSAPHSSAGKNRAGETQRALGELFKAKKNQTNLAFLPSFSHLAHGSRQGIRVRFSQPSLSGRASTAPSPGRKQMLQCPATNHLPLHTSWGFPGSQQPAGKELFHASGELQLGAHYCSSAGAISLSCTP